MVESGADKAAFVWRQTLKRRLLVAALVLIAWSAVIEARLVYLQVGRHGDLTTRAERQQLRTVETTGKRGDILDREGRVLAYSVDADSIYAVPTEITDPNGAAKALCGVLEDCGSRERAALADRIRRGRAFVYVRRQVSPDEARRVAALELEGIGFMKENRRFYPNKGLAAHVLGYVGIDNTGLNGLEASYDTLIKGRPGTVLIQTDARRHAFSRIERPPTTGATIELTIDQYLQYVAERELRAGVAENRAAGGTAVVMDPRNGEILALANWPSFNPNAYRDSRPEAQRNRAIQDLYEPGSTFKIVTASAAFEDKVVDPHEQIDVSAGKIRFGSRVIDDDHNNGVLSFTDVLVKSSNVGAIKVGLKVGPERLGLYMKRFGFGRRTSPDFPGESAGIMWDPAKLTDSALASVSMGYQVGVTPLQMAVAVSSIANGGELFEPRIVRAVIADGTRTPVPHKVVRRTVSPGTAATLTDIMEQVVTRGTGMRAQVPGFTVAGKTGTAQKVVNGQYSRTEYNASFVGFIPSRAPAFVIVVVIDSPHGRNLYYGGSVAAPIFQRIANAALRHQGIPPSINPSPPVLVASRDEPREQATSGPADLPAIVTLTSADAGATAPFPDLRGLGARDAIRTLARMGLTARVRGAGVVVDQVPEAGSPIERGSVVTLKLDRALRGSGGTGDARGAMTIGELLQGLARSVPPDERPRMPADARGLATPCLGVTNDSRQVEAGWVFVALRGLKADGADFAPNAIAAGAAAIVADRPASAATDVPWIVVKDARLALAWLAAEFFRHPSRDMRVIGITGTNGKTTTGFLVSSIVEAAGTRCGLMGTVTYRIGADEFTATRTTPEAPELQGMMRRMVAVGCGACVMEVSSHALALRRSDGIRFAAAIFTNLTRDHLDFHSDMEDYFAAKRRLFDMLPAEAPAVVNADDPRGAAISEAASRPVTYAVNRAADVTPGPLSFSLDGLEFDARTPQGLVHVRSHLVGRPNVYNILAAVAVTAALGFPVEAIERGLEQLEGVPGRFERVSSADDDITVIVDYAHTDDALRNLLEMARPLAARRLITVFGAGGDRDRTKRPLMGMVSARLSDVVVITSDNPRSEDPMRIIDEVNLGAQPETRHRGAEVLSIVDRRDAILHAVGTAEAGDVVLIAGKGHEKYQEIGSLTLPFDDVAVAREALEARRLRARVG